MFYVEQCYYVTRIFFSCVFSMECAIYIASCCARDAWTNRPEPLLYNKGH